MIWLIIAAAFLVVLGTSLIKFGSLSEKVKNLIAIVLSVVVGGAVWLATGGFDTASNVTDAQGVFAIVAAVYGLSQVIYHYLLDGTGLDNKLEAFAAPDNGGGDDPGA